MKSVGIRNLKNQLSKYLDFVREGEVVYVTDRDEIIAEIRQPVSAPTRMLSRWEVFLNEGQRKGSLQRSKQGGFDLAGEMRKLSPTPGQVDLQAILDETRSDRI